MGRGSQKHMDETIGFQPDRCRASRLKGTRRATLRHLDRVVRRLHHEEQQAKQLEFTTAGGRKKMNRRQRQRRAQLVASTAVGIVAALHMMATMWYHRHYHDYSHPVPTLALVSDDEFECTFIWATFWFVVTNLLGWNPAVVLYASLTVLGFFCSGPDGIGAHNEGSVGTAQIGGALNGAPVEVPMLD